MGGAFLLVGCKGNSAATENVVNPESIVTQQTINHTIVQSLNGVRQSKMVAPLMERYDMAREPFMEFPNGIEITTYDSIGSVASTIRANYAIYYEKRQIWEARGNVVGHNVPEERTLRTEQLFWDEKIGRIYSNVKSNPTAYISDRVLRAMRSFIIGDSANIAEEWISTPIHWNGAIRQR